MTDDSDHFAEQFPLSAIDDHMIHQTPDPIRVMWSSDPRTYERHWAVMHDDAGELMVVTGGSFYPSLEHRRGLCDRRSTRAIIAPCARSGRWARDRMDMRIGPIKPTIVEGLRQWRFVLEPNDHGIAFDLDWRDTKRQVFHGSTLPSGSGYPTGRREDVTAGFEGFGTVEGWVEIDGRRIAVIARHLPRHPRSSLGHRPRRRRTQPAVRAEAGARLDRRQLDLVQGFRDLGQRRAL